MTAKADRQAKADHQAADPGAWGPVPSPSPRTSPQTTEGVVDLTLTTLTRTVAQESDRTRSGSRRVWNVTHG